MALSNIFGAILPPRTTGPTLAGRWCYFEPSGMNLGSSSYRVLSRRGGFVIGRIEMRNQWRDWAFYPHSEALFNKEILAEIYKFMRQPDGAGMVRRAKWRAAVREWVLRWL